MRLRRLIVGIGSVLLVVAASCGRTADADRERLDVLRQDPLYLSTPPAGTVETTGEAPAEQLTENTFTRTSVLKQIRLESAEVPAVFEHFVTAATDAGWLVRRVSCHSGGVLLATAVKEYGDWSSLVQFSVTPTTGLAYLELSAQAYELDPGDARPESVPSTSFDLDGTCFADYEVASEAGAS